MNRVILKNMCRGVYNYSILTNKPNIDLAIEEWRVKHLENAIIYI